MQNAVIYARFSSDNQRDESIDAQIRACREYCSRQNYSIVQEYTDHAYSATSDNRPAFQRMIIDAQSGNFQLLIVHKLDRFSRDRYDSVYYRRILRRAKVRLISVLEPLDDSPEAGILESVLEGMAEYYSRNLAREVHKGLKENALKGLWNGGQPPYGYSVVDQKIIINETERPAVEIIFKMYAAGFGYNAIADSLNETGYRTRKGKQFCKNSLFEMLRNEKYIGNYIFNRSAPSFEGLRNNHKNKSDDKIIRIDGAIPRIIDDETWDKVRERTQTQRRAWGRGKEESVKMYLLSGKLYCGYCGAAYIGGGSVHGRNRNYYIYICGNRDRSGSCKAKYIRKELIETEVLSAIKDEILKPERTEQLIQDIIQGIAYTRKEDEKLNNETRKRLIEINKNLNALLDAYLDGTMDKELIKSRQEPLTKERDSLQYQLAKIENSKYPDVKESTIRAYLKSWTDQINCDMDDEQRQEITNQFISRITVYDDHIDIRFKIGSPPSGDSGDKNVPHGQGFGGGGEPLPFIPLSMWSKQTYLNRVNTRK